MNNISISKLNISRDSLDSNSSCTIDETPFHSKKKDRKVQITPYERYCFTVIVVIESLDQIKKKNK